MKQGNAVLLLRTNKKRMNLISTFLLEDRENSVLVIIVLIVVIRGIIIIANITIFDVHLCFFFSSFPSSFL